MRNSKLFFNIIIIIIICLELIPTDSLIEIKSKNIGDFWFDDIWRYDQLFRDKQIQKVYLDLIHKEVNE